MGLLLRGWPCCLGCRRSTLFSWPPSSPNLVAGRSQGDLHAQMNQRWGWGGPSGVHLLCSPQRAHSYCHPRCQRERIEPTSEQSSVRSLALEHEKGGTGARCQGDPARSEPMEQGPQNKPNTKWRVLNRVSLFFVCLFSFTILKK